MPYYKAVGKHPKYIQYVNSDEDDTSCYNWIIGPELNKPIGAFYTPDQDQIPTETKNWHVAKSASIVNKKNKWSPAKVKHFQIHDNGRYIITNISMVLFLDISLSRREGV